MFQSPDGEREREREREEKTQSLIHDNTVQKDIWAYIIHRSESTRMWKGRSEQIFKCGGSSIQEQNGESRTATEVGN